MSSRSRRSCLLPGSRAVRAAPAASRRASRSHPIVVSGVRTAIVDLGRRKIPVEVDCPVTIPKWRGCHTLRCRPHVPRPRERLPEHLFIGQVGPRSVQRVQLDEEHRVEQGLCPFSAIAGHYGERGRGSVFLSVLAVVGQRPMSERERLERAIAAQEGLRGVVPNEVVDAAIAALSRQLAAPSSEVPAASPGDGAVRRT